MLWYICSCFMMLCYRSMFKKIDLDLNIVAIYKIFTLMATWCTEIYIFNSVIKYIYIICDYFK